MKKRYVVEVSHSAMNEASLYERLRDAIFAWHRTEPKVRDVGVTLMPAEKNTCPECANYDAQKGVYSMGCYSCKRYYADLFTSRKQ